MFLVDENNSSKSLPAESQDIKKLIPVKFPSRNKGVIKILRNFNSFYVLAVLGALFGVSRMLAADL
jgi:hypothetical protein